MNSSRTENIDWSKVLCEHYHNVEDHPACLLRMLARYAGKEKPEWYEKARIGYLDIETNNLRPDFAFMFSWVIKERDRYNPDGTLKKVGASVSDLMKFADPYNGNPDTDFHWDRVDSRILKSLAMEILRYDIIVTYYGTRFDIPFTRSRSMYWNLPYAGYGKVFSLDMYYIVRSKMNLSSNRLENVCEFLGIEGKEKLKPEVWRKAIFGNPTALNEIMSHNLADVRILEQVHLRLEPYLRGTKTSI